MNPNVSPDQPRYRSPEFRLAYGVLKAPISALTIRDWQGAEYLPRDVGFLAAGNHISHADPLVFGQFLGDNGCPPRYLAKQALFDLPLAGRIVSRAGQIPVRRESRDATRALSMAIEAVNAGECVALYPEGTLTRDPDLWPMVAKTGAARIALATGCPVIPIAQWGPQDLLAPYAKRPRLYPRTTVHVWAGPPVDLSAYQDREPTPEVLRSATTAIMDAITAILERIRGESAPEQRWDPRDHDLPMTGNPNRQKGKR